MDEVKKQILISLYSGYGLGDAVQMSAVLRHVRKYRPNWTVDYLADEGRHQVARGLCRNHFSYTVSGPGDFYDAEVQIRLYDTWANWGNRPNTRVSSTLRDQFDLEWDPSCGRYQVNLSPEIVEDAEALLNTLAERTRSKDRRMVALHYRGDHAQENKDLSHEQALKICFSVLCLDRTPLLLDWRDQWYHQCKLQQEMKDQSDLRGIATVGGFSFSQDFGRRADANCAVISQCEAFVGIDSGPSKCAAATETPALVVWTGHHPAPFFDPAPNVTHLVPVDYHGLHPVCNDHGVIDWFESHYNVRQYNDDPVKEVDRWLREVLK